MRKNLLLFVFLFPSFILAQIQNINSLDNNNVYDTKFSFLIFHTLSNSQASETKSLSSGINNSSNYKEFNPKLRLNNPGHYYNSSPFVFFDVNLCYNITSPTVTSSDGSSVDPESKGGFKASVLGSIANLLGPIGFSGGLVFQNSKIHFTLQPGLIPNETEANVNRNSLNIPFGFNVASEKYSDFLYSFDAGLNPQIVLSSESSSSAIDISKSDLGLVFGVSVGYKTFQAFGMNVGLLGAVNYSAGLRNLTASGNFINNVKSNILSISLGARFIPFAGTSDY
jgi:hypothetical protein